MRSPSCASRRASPPPRGCAPGVMAAAHRRAALLQADATTRRSDRSVRPRRRFRTRTLRSATRVGSRAGLRWRRPAAALLAATLTLGVLAGTVAAGSAGGPLYATRIWIETVNLPRDVLARAQAEVIRLDRRVQEARDASAAGDTAATEAALAPIRRSSNRRRPRPAAIRQRRRPSTPVSRGMSRS